MRGRRGARLRGRLAEMTQLNATKMIKPLESESTELIKPGIKHSEAQIQIHTYTHTHLVANEEPVSIG